MRGALLIGPFDSTIRFDPFPIRCSGSTFIFFLRTPKSPHLPKPAFANAGSLTFDHPFFLFHVRPSQTTTNEKNTCVYVIRFGCSHKEHDAALKTKFLFESRAKFLRITLFREPLALDYAVPAIRGYGIPLTWTSGHHWHQDQTT